MRVAQALVLLSVVAVADGAGCTNTFSGLTQCAVLNGQTTNADTTTVMQNPELYWLDYTYEQPLSPDTDTTECRAAFNSFHCVNWAHGAGSGPCSTTGQAMPPCFSLCADYVQKCFQRLPTRFGIDRKQEFRTGVVNGARTLMETVILRLDIAGIDNVDAICSRLAPEQNATKCFGDVANFTRLPPATPPPTPPTPPPTPTPPTPPTPPPTTPPPQFTFPPPPNAATTTETAWTLIVFCAVQTVYNTRANPTR